MPRTVNQILLQLRNKQLERQGVRRDKYGRIKKPKPVSPRQEALSYSIKLREFQSRVNDDIDEAMGVLTHGNVRLSLHRGTTADQVDRFLTELPGIVAGLRAEVGL